MFIEGGFVLLKVFIFMFLLSGGLILDRVFFIEGCFFFSLGWDLFIFIEGGIIFYTVLLFLFLLRGGSFFNEEGFIFH